MQEGNLRAITVADQAILRESVAQEESTPEAPDMLQNHGLVDREETQLENDNMMQLCLLHHKQMDALSVASWVTLQGR